MSIEICVFLTLLISLVLNLYLIMRAFRAHKATKTLELEEAVRHKLYNMACRCYELADGSLALIRVNRESNRERATIRAEIEFDETATTARIIGYHVPFDWRHTFRQFRPVPREPGKCSDPNHW